MSRYVQTFSERDQVILDHAAFQPVISVFEPARDGQDIAPLWTNSSCKTWSFNDPDKGQPCIRRKDIEEFLENWIRGTSSTANFDGPFRGHYTPVEWTRCGAGYEAKFLVYRTFMLCEYVEPPPGVVVPPLVALSTTDLEQILTSCLDAFHEDEIPLCTGESLREDDGQRAEWRVLPVPRPRLESMIESTKNYIRIATSKALKNQHTVIAALQRLRPSEQDLERGTTRQRQQTLGFVRDIDGVFERLGVDPRNIDPYLADERSVDEYARYPIVSLERWYVNSGSRLQELDWAVPRPAPGAS